jgi:hypothetical protein
MCAHAGHINQVSGAAWIPLVFFLFDRALRRRSIHYAVGAGVTVGVALRNYAGEVRVALPDPGDGWLGTAQRLPRPGKAAQVDQGHKGAQQIRVNIAHAHTLLPLPWRPRGAIICLDHGWIRQTNSVRRHGRIYSPCCHDLVMHWAGNGHRNATSLLDAPNMRIILGP